MEAHNARHWFQTRVYLCQPSCSSIRPNPTTKRLISPTGYPKQSNTSSRITHGQRRDEPLTLKPSTSHSHRGGLWRKGKPAYWEQLRVRLHQAMNQSNQHRLKAEAGSRRALQDVQRHWLGDPAWALFLDTCYHWLQFKDDRTADLMEQTMSHQLQRAGEEALRSLCLASADPFMVLEGGFLSALGLCTARADRVRQRLQTWKQLSRGPTAPSRSSLRPRSIATQLLRAAPAQALPPLLKLLQDMEATATMPTQLQMHMVVAGQKMKPSKDLSPSPQYCTAHGAS